MSGKSAASKENKISLFYIWFQFNSQYIKKRIKRGYLFIRLSFGFRFHPLLSWLDRKFDRRATSLGHSRGSTTGHSFKYISVWMCARSRLVLGIASLVLNASGNAGDEIMSDLFSPIEIAPQYHNSDLMFPVKSEIAVES